MPKIKAGDIQINYERNGKGQPLLLITGIGYGKWFWHKIVPGLAEKFQVITFDNRGAGETGKPAGPYTISMMANDTANLLEALELENVHIMGHSLGGFIAQELGVYRPDLVNRLILASTNFGGKKVVPTTPEAYKILTNRQGDPVELVRRGIAVACAPGFEERQPQVVQELLNYRFTGPVPAEQFSAQVAAGEGTSALTDQQVNERMAALRMPVLVLFGEEDRVVPPENAVLMAEKLPDARVKIIPNTGHIFPIEDPEATIQAMVEFLSEGEA